MDAQLNEREALSRFSTADLCGELERRGSVRTVKASFPAEDKVWVSAEPPCVIYIVTD